MLGYCNGHAIFCVARSTTSCIPSHSRLPVCVVQVRRLAEEFLTDYTQLNVGSLDLSANHNILQIVDVCESHEKFQK